MTDIIWSDSALMRVKTSEWGLYRALAERAIDAQKWEEWFEFEVFGSTELQVNLVVRVPASLQALVVRRSGDAVRGFHRAEGQQMRKNRAKAPKSIVDAYQSDDPVVRTVLILADQRGVTTSLLGGTMKWCRSRFSDLNRELAEPHGNSSSDATELIQHLSRLQGLMYQLNAQNVAMLALYEIAVEWPDDIPVTVSALSEKP